MCVNSKRYPPLQHYCLSRKETFLKIYIDSESCSQSLMDYSKKILLNLRSDIENYIKIQHDFLLSFKPLNILPCAPPIVISMHKAAQAANVGPMAAVAGAIADELGKKLNKYCHELIIENGGDLYVHNRHKRILGIYAGKNEFSYKIGLEISEKENAFGLCTSSGTTGPSISLGKADAAIIKAESSALADAVATATANLIQTPQDLQPAIEFATKIPGIKGVIVIKDECLAAWGNMKLVKIS